MEHEATAVARTVEALARLDALHTALTRVLLEGAGPDRLLAEASRVLDLPLLLTSTDGREQTSMLPAHDRERLLRRGLLDEAGRLRPETVDSARREPVTHGGTCVVPVVAAGADLGRLVAVLRPGRQGQAELPAVERVAALAAVLLTRQEAAAAAEGRYRAELLRDVLLGRAGGPEEVSEQARSLGWDLDRPVVVVAAELDPATVATEASPASRRHQQERFARVWHEAVRGLGADLTCVDLVSEVVVLLPVPAEPHGVVGGEPAGADVVRRVVAAVAGDRSREQPPFTCGVSRVAATVADLPAAYAQARRTVEVGRRLHGGGATSFFDRLGLHRLLALVPDPGELRSFARDVLGPLAEDDPDAADLRETLQVLLDTNFNLAAAARAQFFHYNTVRGRLARLERLLGPLSSDPHLRLDAAVALRVLDITG